MWYAICAKKSGLSREIDANGKTTMDYYLLADMTVQIGYELAIAGAETYRVEETMRRVIAAYGTEGQAFAIPNCVAVSFVAQNTKPLTIMKRVGYHGNDLERIEKLNALSRRICAEVPELAEAQRWLKETVASVRSYATGVYYLGNFIAAAGFCCVFGGTVRDWLWAGLSGLIIGFVTRWLDRLEVNQFFSTIAASFLMALPAYIAAGLGWLDCVAVVIIGALMLLVPGLLITNSMRDIIYGDTNSGINRIVQVFLIAAALAVGTATAWSLAERLWGAPVSAPAVDHSVLAQCLFACIGCFGFSILFNIHGPGGILCTIGGIACWVVFWLSQRLGFSEILSYFWASLFASLYSEIMARIRKYPAISYLLVSAFPLIPGAGVYYTMNFAVRGEMDMFAYRGMNTAAIAGIMAVGILLGSTVFRMYAQWKSRRMRKKT